MLIRTKMGRLKMAMGSLSLSPMTFFSCVVMILLVVLIFEVDLKVVEFGFLWINLYEVIKLKIVDQIPNLT